MRAERRKNDDDKKAKPATDPVCGRELSRRGNLAEVCGGERFFFCSDACRKRFLDDPTRYTVSCIETK